MSLDTDFGSAPDPQSDPYATMLEQRKVSGKAVAPTNTAPEVPDSPYAAMLAKRREATTTTNLLTDVGKVGAPADVAKALELKAKIGADALTAMDPSARKVYEDSARKANVPVAELVGSRTAEWALQDPLHVDLTGGKYEELLALEKAHKEAQPGFFSSMLGSMMSRSGSVGKGWTTDASRLGETNTTDPFKLSDLLKLGTPSGMGQLVNKAIALPARSMFPALDAHMRKVSASNEEMRKAFDDVVFGPGQAQAKKLISEDRWIANAVGGAFPDIVMALAAARAGGGAAGAETAGASPAAASIFSKLGSYLAKSAPEMTKQAAVMFPGLLSAEADEYQQFNPGGSRVEAVGKAATSALVQSVMEGLVNVPIIERMAKAKTITSRVLGLVMSGQMEGAEEVYQRAASQFLLDDPSGNRKLSLQDLWENYRGGMVAGVVFGAGALATSKEARAQSQFIKALNNPETIKGLAPGARADFITHLTKDGPLANLLVDAKGFNAYFGESAPKMAEKLGVSSTDFAMAVEQGSDLVVPTGKYDEHIAGTDHFGPVYNMTRLYQGGPTLQETNQAFDNEQTLKELGAAMAALPSSAERDHLKGIIAGELGASSKVFTQSMVEEIADNVARQITVLAQRAKTTPMQLFEKNRLKIVSGVHAIVDSQLGADHALTDPSKPALGKASEAIPAQDSGRASEGLSGQDVGRPAAAGGRSEAVLPGRTSRTGEGLRPHVDAVSGVMAGFHGTPIKGLSSLKAEGLGAAPAMGPGLHISAAPAVATAHMENNPEGLYRVGFRRDYTPFDATMDASYSPEQAKQLGVDDLTTDLTGAELWEHLVGELGKEGAAQFLEDQGFHGLYYNYGGEDAWSVWRDEHLIGSRPISAVAAEDIYSTQERRRDEITGQLKVAQRKLWQALPARVPSAVGSVLDLNNLLVTDLEAMLAAPETLHTVLNEVGTWPGVNLGKGSDKARANRFIEHAKNNLLWLYDKMPADVRSRAKLWYDGAQRIAQKFADDSGKTLQQAAGIIAALSPQQGWFSNIELAKQVFDVLDTKQNFAWTKEMSVIAKSTPSIAKEKAALANIKGKMLSELTSDFDKAVWLRVYSEAHGDKTFNITTPEGESMGKALNKAGTKPLALGWLADFGTLAKVVRVFEDASPAAVHAAIGTANKVRNFYNNIYNPEDANFTTIDTHAAAAGLLMPLAASDNEANFNFSGNESNAVGIRGSYGLFYEAYKRAAAERGVLPREMQSITWEAVRGLFEADQKKGSETRRVKGEDVTKSTLYWATADIWKQVKQGKISEAQGREEILKLAGGITPPSWSGQTSKFFQMPNAQDFFEGQITAESMPGGNVRSGIFPNIDNATPEQLQSYHTAKMGIVLNTLRAAGVAVERTQQGHGYWDGETNPVTAFVIKVTDAAQLNEAAAIAADVMNDQDAVAWNAKPEPDAPVAEHNAVMVDYSRALTSQELLTLGMQLEASGLPVFPDASNPASIRIISYDFTPSPETAAQLHSNIQAVIDSVLPADVTYEAGSYKATSNLVNRGAFDEGTQEGSPSVQRRAIAGGRAQVEALNERYFTQHGWGSDAGAEGRSGGLPVFQANSGSLNPVEAHLVHYGNTSGLSSLEGSRYGEGSPGREGRRLASEPKGSPILLRVYGYESQDGGLPPKERVVKGEVPYEVKATNLYDLEADPEGLRANNAGDGNAIEHAVLNANYDGYITSAAGIPGRAVVLLGHATVPVRSHGGKLDIENAQGGVTRVAQATAPTLPPEFAAWFGEDSTNVNADGSPMTLSHGTDHKAKITEFKESKTGALGQGIYLGQNDEASKGYGKDIMHVFARGKYLDNYAWTDYVQKFGWAGAREQAIKDGWAGIRDDKFEDAVVVWDSKNIKSVENTGAFSETGNIYYAGGKDSPRGYLEFPNNTNPGDPRKFGLTLLENENRSTVFHELGHFYLELLGDMAEDPSSDQSVKDDYATILKWLGAKDRSQITTPMHEKFADGHLVYLKEGKAPIQELQSSFQKYSKWLTKIGTQLLGVEVNMTDEVRGVFDRLYATETEIEEAKQDITTQMFTTAEQAGMTQAEFAVYSKSVEKEVVAAKEKLLKRLMRDLENQQKREYKDQLAKVTVEVEADVNNRPEYLASRQLADSMMTDGETPILKLDRGLLIDMYGTDILDKLPKEGTSTIFAVGDNTISPDEAAIQLNLFDTNGDTLIQALTDLANREQTIKQLAKEQMDLTHPDLLSSPEALQEQALEILHGEGRERILTTELQALRRKQSQALPAVRQARAEASAQAKAAAQDREALSREQQRISATEKQQAVFPKLKVLREKATEHIQNMQAFKVRPHEFLNAQRKAGKESFEALKRQDYKTSAEAKERELLSHYLYIEAVKAKEATEDFRDYIKKVDSNTSRANMAKAGQGILAQFDRLRDRFTIERTPNKQIMSNSDLATWIESMVKEMKDVKVVDWLLRESDGPVNYRELSVAQMNDLHDALKSIRHQAKIELQFLLDGKWVFFDTAFEELTYAAEKNLGFKPVLDESSPGAEATLTSAKAHLMGLDSTMVKVLQLVNWIDGNDVNGPAHRYIWHPIVSSQVRDYELSHQINKIITSAYEAMPKSFKGSLKQTFDIGLLGEDDKPRMFYKKEIIGMLLYSGQDTRLQKLIGGRMSKGLTQEAIDKAFTHLTKEDLQVAESVWGAFDAMRPTVLDLEERLTGVRPQWEAAREFDVIGPDGTITGHMKGGYFPLVADRSSGKQVSMKQEGGTVQEVMSGNGYSRATTSQSHTKDITGKLYPLLLDFDRIVTAELSNQIKDIAYRENVLMLNRIFRNERFTDVMIRRLGPAYTKQFQPWLVNIVSDRNTGATAGMAEFDGIAGRMRGNAASAMIAFKLSSLMVQPADLLRTLAPGTSHGIKAWHLTNAWVQLNPTNSNRRETIDMIKRLSPTMVMREENVDRDLRANMQRLSGDESWNAAAQRMGFSGFAAVDSLISWPVWLAKYNEKVAEHADETRAALEADDTVNMLLQAGAPKDLSPLQGNKNPWMRLFTMFFGDATNNYNLLRDAGHNINGMKGVPTFTGTVVFIMLGQILGDFLKGQWPDDDEEWGKWAATKAVLAPLSAVPFGRDFGNLGDAVLRDKPLMGMQFSPAFTVPQKLANAVFLHPKRLAKGDEDFADFVINELEAVGYAGGVVGTSQATASVKYFKRYMEGDEKPANPAQFAWDLARGKKKEKP